MKKKLIVIGGGAAGFFCALNAARLHPALEVMIVEKSNKLLSKVKVSGGGRCNVTHACFEMDAMAKCYPRGGHFVRKIFHDFFVNDTIQWFTERGVLLKTEPDGRMFPETDSSQTIINCLLNEAAKTGVSIRMNCGIIKIEKKEDQFIVTTQENEILSCNFLCIATGGFPKAAMFDWLIAIGHTIATPVPSLFTFNLSGQQTGKAIHPLTKLMGISVPDVRITIQGSKLKQQGPLLITHWGLSGPCVLKLSAWAARELAIKNWNFAIAINWLPDMTETATRNAFQQNRLESASQKLHYKNAFNLPQRLWVFLLLQSGIHENMRWADLPAKNQNLFIKHLINYEVTIKGKTTYKEEFVTAGGITLSEIVPQTMMSKIIPNLFFAGEVIDVDGITGGYNFQNAWSTGFVAAKNIALLANKS